MDTQKVAERAVREVFRFDIPSGSGDEIGAMALRFVYHGPSRGLIETRVRNAIDEALTHARKSEQV